MRVRALVAHAEWDASRVASLDRLEASIGDGDWMAVASEEREHANKWATRLWRRGSEQKECDLLVFLNDDVVCHPKLFEYVAQLAELLPGEVLSLHCQFPGLREAALAGHRLARCYWPSGPAYVMTPAQAGELLAWLGTITPGWFAGDVNEDGAIAAWLWSRQSPAYCTAPALVRHDTSIPSTLGYDNHPNRQSHVDWDEFAPDVWDNHDVMAAPYIPVPWMTDGRMRGLGDALRGVATLCGLCRNASSSFVNYSRGTGVCGGCARAMASRLTGNVTP